VEWWGGLGKQASVCKGLGGVGGEESETQCWFPVWAVTGVTRPRRGAEEMQVTEGPWEPDVTHFQAGSQWPLPQEHLRDLKQDGCSLLLLPKHGHCPVALCSTLPAFFSFSLKENSCSKDKKLARLGLSSKLPPSQLPNTET
jgi:hypothetical protein